MKLTVLCRNGFAVAVGVLLLGLSLYIPFERKLVGTISLQEWGRYQLAVGAAITQAKYGIGGFVSEDYIDTALVQGGLGDRPLELDLLGFAFPDNLRNEALLQKALERARDVDVGPPANTPDENGYYSRLHGQYGQDVGLVTYTRLGFMFFGFSLVSLTLMYFTIWALSMALFVVGN